MLIRGIAYGILITIGAAVLAVVLMVVGTIIRGLLWG